MRCVLATCNDCEIRPMHIETEIANVVGHRWVQTDIRIVIRRSHSIRVRRRGQIPELARHVSCATAIGRRRRGTWSRDIRLVGQRKRGTGSGTVIPRHRILMHYRQQRHSPGKYRDTARGLPQQGTLRSINRLELPPRTW